MTAALPKTFLITGVSSGLGRAFAQGALDAGHRVIGTVRQRSDVDAFAALAPDRAHPLVLDVTDYASIPAAVASAEQKAGPIDVLVNNAATATRACWRSPRSTTCNASSPPTCSGPWR